MCLLLLLMKTMKLKKNMIGRTHPWNAAFPDITVSFDSDENNDDKVGYIHGAGKAKAQEDDVIFVRETIDCNCDVLPIEYAITIAFSMLIGKVAGYCQL